MPIQLNIMKFNGIKWLVFLLDKLGFLSGRNWSFVCYLDFMLQMVKQTPQPASKRGSTPTPCTIVLLNGNTCSTVMKLLQRFRWTNLEKIKKKSTM